MEELWRVDLERLFRLDAGGLGLTVEIDHILHDSQGFIANGIRRNNCGFFSRGFLFFFLFEGSVPPFDRQLIM